MDEVWLEAAKWAAEKIVLLGLSWLVQKAREAIKASAEANRLR